MVTTAHSLSSPNNVHENFRCFLLAENKCILMQHECQVVTRVQITNSACTLSKFRLSCLSVIFFSCKLLTSNKVISHANCCNDYK